MQIQFVRGLAAIAMALSALGAQAAGYGSNLIVNGDAEAGTDGWTALAGVPLFVSTEYSSNWVKPTEPGPVDRGTMLFVGGGGAPFVGGSQQLDLTANGADISTGQVQYQLNGWLGGWTNQQDNALLYVSFLDAANTEIGYSILGPVTPTDRNDTTGLFYRETTGLLPAATRAVVFSLSMERVNGGDIDGYADNLSFSLAPVPEPGTYALMLLGLAAVGGVAARRHAGTSRTQRA
jgi:hypothetical protein